MLKWLSPSVRFACGVCFSVSFLLSALHAQEPKSPSDAPESKSPAAKTPADATPAETTPAQKPDDTPADAPAPPADTAPADTAPADTAPPKEAPAQEPAVPAAQLAPAAVDVPPYDYSRLGHPSVADQLDLTDQQRATIAELLNARATALAGAEAQQRAAVITSSDQQLVGVLTDEQRTQLTTLVASQKLRFNFRFQKWEDVLDWFARQAGLALVMDQPPSGAFTYSDNRAYTPTEAIDLLNSVLLTKGLTLIQRDRMLILVNLSDDLPRNLIPRVEPEEIGQRGKFEIISVLFPLGRRPADSVVKELQPLLGKYGSCVGLPQTAQLLVTETGGRMQAISILLASIPEPPLPKTEPPAKKEPPPPPPKFEVYAVTAIDPQKAVDTLKLLFPNAKLEIDDKVDQIMVFATPAEQAGIKAAIDQMQANRPPEKRPKVEIYPLDVADGEQVLEQLKIILPDVQATVNADTGQLMVFAEPQDHETLKEVIQKLGAGGETATKQVVVYQPKHFDPTALATLIEQLVPRAEISTDAELRRVVVATSPSNQDVVKSLVEQLDQEAALEDQPRLQVYALDKPFDATMLATLTGTIPNAQATLSTDGRRLMVMAREVDQTIVKKLVDQWQALAAEEEQPALKIYPLDFTLAATDVTTISTLVPDAQATLTTDGRQLRVVARAADQAEVAKLLEQLEQAATAGGKPELTVLPLDKPLSSTVLTTLTSLIPEAKVSLSTDGRRLIVVGRTTDQALVKKLVDQWQQIASEEEEPTLQIYPLEFTLAATDLTTITTLVPEAQATLSTDGRQLRVVGRESDHVEVEKLVTQLKEAATGQVKPTLSVYPLKKPLNPTVLTTLTTLVPKAQVTVSSDTRRLIVLATAEDALVIKSTLDQVQASEDLAGQRALEIYQLDGIPAAQLQTLLQPLVVESTVTVDAPQDRLIVWGPAEEHQAFSEVLAKLADDPLAGTKPILKFYPLANEALSTSITTVLTTLVPTAKVTWDAEGERLMVIATPKDQLVVDQTIEEVLKDAPAAEQPTIRIYTLDAAQRTKFQLVKEDLLREHVGMRVIEDPQTGELAVWARQSQHDDLAAVLDQLKSTDEGVDRLILMAYPIQHATAKVVFDMLTEVYPTAKLTLDEKSDRIVVQAPLNQHGRIKQTIAQLDVESLPSNKEELRSYSLGTSDPTPLLPLLQKLVPDMQLTAEVPTRRIIAWGAIRDHATLAKAIEQFREGGPGQRPTIVVYPMDGRSPTSLIYLRTVLTQVAPDAVIAIDMSGGSMVVSGTAADHEAIKAAIDQVLEMDRKATWTLETYTLENTKAATVMTTLRSIVPDAQLSAGATPEQLVVWCSQEDHERIEAAVAKLEESAGEPGDRELRVHRIQKAAATQAASMISTTLPDLQILSGQGTSQLLIWGSPKDHERLEEMIQQLEKELRLDIERKVKVFELDEISPTDAQRVLDAAVGELEYITSPAPGRLVVWADPAKFEEVQKILDEMKKVVMTPEQVVRVHKYEPEKLNVSTIYAALSPADMKDLSIQVNPTTNSLIVRGATERQDELAETLAQLEKQLPAADVPTAEIYRLNVADTSAVSIVVRSLVPTAGVAVDAANKTLAITATAKDHAKIKSIIDQLDASEEGELVTETYVLQRANPTAIVTAVQPIVPRATISPDVYNKTLIVTGTAADQKKIKAIIDQADNRGEGDLVTTAYPLKWANPYSVSTALAPVVPGATISADIYGKMLIVTGSKTEHERVKAVLDQADQRGGGELITKAYTLQTANPSTILVALQPVVPDAKVSSDPTNQMLIVTASAEDHKKIQDIVDEADRRSEGELTTEVYSLKWANPTAISYSIRPIAPKATVSPDVYNKTLIVTATAKDHKRIKAIVDQADQRSGGELTTKAYNLKWANGSTISLALTSVVPDARISSDVYNKMLIVTANQEDHDKIQTVLDQADQRGGGELTTKAYMLQTANPTTIMVALQPVVPDAKISSDPTNQMLIVTASADDHEKVKGVVDEADRRSEGELTTEVYSLKWANPTAISLSIRPIAPKATVSPDIYNKTLIVTATAKDHQRIKAVVDQADQRGGGDLTTQAYILKWANPTAVSTALTNVVPDAKISSDIYNKMLIVTANKEDHEKIKAVLDKADMRGGGELETKAYTLQRANPTTIMVALQPVVPDAKISSDPTNQMLIVTASAADHKKIQAVVDEADRREDGEYVTTVYTLKWANPTALSYSLKPIAPSATVSPDVYNKTLIVTASQKDQERIKTIVEQADKRGSGDMITKAYSLKWANPTIISTALAAVVPEAVISSDIYNKMLIATASQDDHDRIQAVLDQADERGGGDLVTNAYTLRLANPSTLMLALRPLVPDATISADPTNRVLIVTASAEDQTRVKTIVDQADRRSEGELSTVVYPFKLASPASIATALRALVPNATITSDASTNTMIVTSTAEDHSLIEPLVAKLDVADPKAPVLKPYQVDHADPQEVYTSLTQLFRYDRDVSIGYSEETGMILVFAPAAQQEELGKAIVDIDKALGERPQAIMEVYALDGIDGDAAVDSLSTLLEKETPKIDLQVDSTNNQILAIAEPAQHAMIAKALSQLTPIEREVEVFNLQRVDPFTAESAIDTLFADLPFGAMPSVEADPDTQQLIVRATATQIARIQQLLEKMGEGPKARRAVGPGSMLRVVPMSGDTETLLRQIQQIWPQIRGNPMQIVPAPPRGSSSRRDADQGKPRPQPAPKNKPDPADAEADAERRPAADSDQSDQQTAIPASDRPFMLVSAQAPADPASQDPRVLPAPLQDPPMPGAPVPSAPIPSLPGQLPPAAAGVDPSLPPIVVIAGDGRVTIASQDQEALDAFENLLKTLLRGKRVAIATGNFSMFLLENADAGELAETLNELFRRGSRASQNGGYRQAGRRSTNMMVVADQRMNALLVYGSMADRAVVEELLDVLDSLDIPDTYATERPRMIPVENLPAATVLTVLESVYKSQLSARRGLRPLTIPQGISPEMASMLQVVNAEAEAPVLTLDTDETTNSIVMRAPRQLAEEVEEFIREIDEQAMDGGSRSISLVPLKSMNTEQIQDALQLLMRRGRYGGRR